MSRKFFVASVVAISMITIALAQSTPLFANLVIRVGHNDGKPVAGAYVILHRADGSVRKFKVTGSNGLADLGPVTAVRGTLTFAYDGQIITFMKIPFSSTVMKFNLFYSSPPAPVGQIHVSLPPLEGGGYVWPVDEWVNPTDTVDIHKRDLQGDGKLSLTGYSWYPDNSQWTYGFLLDQNLVSGRTYTINVDRTPPLYTFNATTPISYFYIDGQRKRISHPVAGYWSDISTVSETIPVADQIPGIEKYWTTAGLLTDTVDDFWVAPQTSLQLALQASLPALSVGSVSYDDTLHVMSWELLNTEGADAQGVYLVFPSYTTWDVWMSPAAVRQWDRDRLSLPAEVEAWIGDRTLYSVQAWAERYVQFAGFDPYIQKVAGGAWKTTAEYFFASKWLDLPPAFATSDSLRATRHGCRTVDGRPSPGRHRLLFDDGPRMVCPSKKGAPSAGSERF